MVALASIPGLELFATPADFQIPIVLMVRSALHLANANAPLEVVGLDLSAAPAAGPVQFAMDEEHSTLPLAATATAIPQLHGGEETSAIPVSDLQITANMVVC
jgi:hypothetical protein